MDVFLEMTFDTGVALDGIDNGRIVHRESPIPKVTEIELNPPSRILRVSGASGHALRSLLSGVVLARVEQMMRTFPDSEIRLRSSSLVATLETRFAFEKAAKEWIGAALQLAEVLPRTRA